MEKLYVHEFRPDDEVSTVGLFYSRGEAEDIVAQLQSLPEKQNCRYEIVNKALGPPAYSGKKTSKRMRRPEGRKMPPFRPK